MQITTIGLDLAKHWFQVHGVDADGRIVVRRRLWRGFADQSHLSATFRRDLGVTPGRFRDSLAYLEMRLMSATVFSLGLSSWPVWPLPGAVFGPMHK